MKRVLNAALSGLAALALSVAQAEDDLTVEIKRLSMDAARQIARSAVDACRAKGIQIGVTVVDRNGIAQVVMRDTLAPPLTLPISQGKAYAAVMFNVPTSELGERANTPIGRVPGVVMSGGGVPIQAAGALVGGVGVSGAPSVVTDEECARAGIEAVQDDLDMAG